MTVTVRLPPASVRVLAVLSSQVVRVSIPGSTGGSGGGSAAWGGIGGLITNQLDLIDAINPYNVAFTDVGGQTTVADTFIWLGQQIDGLYADLTGKAGLFSPSFTGTPLAPTATGGTNTTQIATTAFVQSAVNAVIAAADAMVFKGVIDCSANPNYPAADRGWTYKVSVAGKIGGASGVNVEAGDTLICLTDGTASGNHATVGASWNITQANLDGAVVGPASSVDGYFALFSGSSGKLLASVSPTAVKAALGIVAADIGDSTSAGRSMLTAANAAAQTALLDVFGASTKGLVPSPGGTVNTTDFLRRDGSWATPPGGSSGPTVLSSTSTGTQNNWNPGTIGDDTLIRWAGTAPLILTGLAAGTDGQSVTLRNESAASLALITHNFSTSTAANRFNLLDVTGPVLLTPGDRVEFVYSASSSRWVQVYAPSGGIRVSGVHIGMRAGSGGTVINMGIAAVGLGGSINFYQDTVNRFRAYGYHWMRSSAAANSVTGIRSSQGLAVPAYGFLHRARMSFNVPPASSYTGFAGLYNSSSTPSGTADWGAFTLAMLGVGHDGPDSSLYAYHGDDGATPTRVSMGSGFTLNGDLQIEVWVYMPHGGGSATIVASRLDSITVAPYAEQFASAIPASTRLLNPYIALGNRSAGAFGEISYQHQDLWRP